MRILFFIRQMPDAGTPIRSGEDGRPLSAEKSACGRVGDRSPEEAR